MNSIKKQYIIDEKNRKIGVQLDLKTFEKIEEIMENYALFNLMSENDDDEILDLEKAKE
jgi:RelB Antitoxin